MLSGYIFKTEIFLVAVVFMTLIKCALSEVTIPPLNTVGFLGNQTTLKCEISLTGTDVTVQQWEENYSERVDRVIAVNDAVSTDYSSRYRVDGEKSKYNLVVVTSQYAEAGTHKCTDVLDVSSPNKFKSAEIIILDSNPMCTTNSTIVGDIFIQGEYVYYMCTVRYSGLWGPKMIWSSNDGSITPADESDDTLDPKLVQYSYTTMVSSGNDGQSLRVVTSFDPPVFPPNDSDKNAPDYEYTWDSPAITVHYPPRDIVLNHCTDSTCNPISDNDITINPYDRIQASAAANPNVDNFLWKNDTDILQDGGQNEYTFTDIGTSSINCTVRNTMRGGLRGTSTRTILVMVVATTTPPPTTTPISTIPSSPETSTGTGGPPATDESTEKDGLGAGAIAGIAIGVLAAIVICVIIIICVCRKSDKEKKANETMPPKKVHADQVRQPENNGPTTITNIDEKPPYDYNQYPENPYDNNVNPYAQDGRPNENLVYADLALDDTPRSRKPVQVFEPVQYAEIRRV